MEIKDRSHNQTVELAREKAILELESLTCRVCVFVLLMAGTYEVLKYLAKQVN